MLDSADTVCYSTDRTKEEGIGNPESDMFGTQHFQLFGSANID